MFVFLIDFSIGGDNHINIIIDGDNGVLVEDCMFVSRAIEHNIDREEFDFGFTAVNEDELSNILKNVPDDESNEIRSILTAHDIDYYETNSGTFGIGMAGIWLHDESKFDTAKGLLDEYSEKRLAQAQLELRHAIENNVNETFFKKLLREPFKILLFMVAVGAVLYISVVAFIEMMGE